MFGFVSKLTQYNKNKISSRSIGHYSIRILMCCCVKMWQQDIIIHVSSSYIKWLETHTSKGVTELFSCFLFIQSPEFSGSDGVFWVSCQSSLMQSDTLLQPFGFILLLMVTEDSLLSALHPVLEAISQASFICAQITFTTLVSWIKWKNILTEFSLVILHMFTHWKCVYTFCIKTYFCTLVPSTKDQQK